MSLITTKFHEILLSGFRKVSLTRKRGPIDWLTDWLTEPSYPGASVTIGAFMLWMAIISTQFNLIGDGIVQLLKIITLALQKCTSIIYALVYILSKCTSEICAIPW